jgi:16S rRNA (guanine(966)-N(2))-methyltransferase RsmD
MTLRLIAGKFKGQKISTPKNIRPATSFVKEAIFNICQNQIKNSNFLDLFAGSGSIGLEALSRGAKFATFIDKSPSSIRYIKKNIKNLGVEKITKVFCLDVKIALKKLDDIFDIVSIDPPFIIYKNNPSYINEILNLLSCLIDKNSLIFLEEPTYSKRVSNTQNLILKKTKRYSSANLLIYSLK